MNSEFEKLLIDWPLSIIGLINGIGSGTLERQGIKYR